ncbi:hypothetical protein ABZ917_22390 [Nonomuraea wenchangensis]
MSMTRIRSDTGAAGPPPERTRTPSPPLRPLRRKPLSAWKDIVVQWKQTGGDQVARELAEEYAANQ